jgi:hypothetical protein
MFCRIEDFSTVKSGAVAHGFSVRFGGEQEEARSARTRKSLWK